MNKIGTINYKEIKRISPSQFYSMKNCAHKSLLAEAFDKKTLLPLSPNVYLGTVLHKMLELLAKGVIQNENDLNKNFDEQINIVEDDLKKTGYDFFIPLQKNIKDFGLKKILLKKHLRSVAETPIKTAGVTFYSEKWFESKDKLIAGKLDLIIESQNRIEIIDFKTGAITENVLDDSGEIFAGVKEEYKEQLKLYAYLYFENTGNFPTDLSLIDLAKQKFVIQFSGQECKAIFEEAKKLLQATNDSFANKVLPANPTKINCKYCLFRPACADYIKQLETDFSFNDVTGLVKNVTRYQNNEVSVFIQNGDIQFTVRKFSTEKYEELHNSINKRINIFNLRKEAIDFVYSTTKITMIYEC
jgi:CRISPR/Cas system-associated exonuclease Cas4 (RecB family)